MGTFDESIHCSHKTKNSLVTFSFEVHTCLSREPKHDSLKATNFSLALPTLSQKLKTWQIKMADLIQTQR